jgi:hypothetical protein
MSGAHSVFHTRTAFSASDGSSVMCMSRTIDKGPGGQPPRGLFCAHLTIRCLYSSLPRDPNAKDWIIHENGHDRTSSALSGRGEPTFTPCVPSLSPHHPSASGSSPHLASGLPAREGRAECAAQQHRRSSHAAADQNVKEPPRVSRIIMAGDSG